MTYRDLTIADALALPVKKASEVFSAYPKVTRILQTLSDVGLDYLHLGQPAPTLSGGEAQRVKLSRELAKKSTGSTLYVLDEPTTGLHFDDIRKLLSVLDRLVSAGNTVVVIEHNLDVIKCADHIIDLGPEATPEAGWWPRARPKTWPPIPLRPPASTWPKPLPTQPPPLRAGLLNRPSLPPRETATGARATRDGQPRPLP
jgi:ABC-type uncharacterized transport system fused permease/ATPase subunit